MDDEPLGTVGGAWSPYDPKGDGRITSEKQVEGFLEATVGTKQFFLSSRADTVPPERRLVVDDFARGGRLNQVELVYYAGHGTSSSVQLHRGDDGQVPKADIHEIEFDGAKWVVFDACLTLIPDTTDAWNTVGQRWAPVFRGLRCLLGFASSTTGWASRGATFGELLSRGETIADAWAMATEETEGIDPTPSLCACLVAVDLDGRDAAEDQWLPRREIADSARQPAGLKLIVRTA